MSGITNSFLNLKNSKTKAQSKVLQILKNVGARVIIIAMMLLIQKLTKRNSNSDDEVSVIYECCTNSVKVKVPVMKVDYIVTKRGRCLHFLHKKHPQFDKKGGL